MAIHKNFLQNQLEFGKCLKSIIREELIVELIRYNNRQDNIVGSVLNTSVEEGPGREKERKY